MDLAQLEKGLLTDLPVGIKYALQKLAPAVAKVYINNIVTALQAINTEGQEVTETELINACKGLAEGIVSVVPEGKAKEVAETSLSFAEKVIDKFDGASHETIIGLLIDGGKAFTEIKSELKG